MGGDVAHADKIAFAKSLRRNATDAEQRLWALLRSRRFLGYKFRRQHLIPPYIVDFCCVEKRLVVELDGGQHVQIVEHDARRTADLERRGFRVVRFWNDRLFTHKNDVQEAVLTVLSER
jgi:very-short-patch-repair endonuclease